VKISDQETVLATIDVVRRILGEYIEPGPRDPAATLHRILTVMDDGEFVRALDHLNRRRVIRLVE
jgi:hypothetical protein